MCGVIGIISNKSVPLDLFLGMLCLQHRGQDSAGIITFNGNFKVKKEKGFVESIFTEKDLKELSAPIGIGHTRYPTIGSDFKTDAQPCFIEFPLKIALAHNGQVTNYFELKEEFKKKNVFLSSSCDAELILRVLAEELSRTGINSPEQIFKAVENLLKRVKGAYSVVALIEGKGLLAFRDVHGIKPLVMGRKNSDCNAIAFASESIALYPNNFELVRNLNAGEAVFVDSSSLKVFSKQFSREKPFHCMFEWVYFARAESVLESIPVYEARLNLGRELARKWLKLGIEADVVFPVPDTSRTAAGMLAEILGLPCREGLIKNRYIGRTFIMASQRQRENSVLLKLNPIVSEIKGKRIILVDDSIVRGTTSKKIVELLRKCGAKKVFFLSTCPPIRFPCFYGIDMPIKKELIASDKTVEEVRQHIGADVLLYLDKESLLRAINSKNLCTACLDGKYPVRVSEQVIKDFEKTRTMERKKVSSLNN
jgi:amidophosphoribosyltransferase